MELDSLARVLATVSRRRVHRLHVAVPQADARAIYEGVAAEVERATGCSRATTAMSSSALQVT